MPFSNRLCCYNFSGLFGLNIVKETDEIICITEGEFDAMSVTQSTGIPAVSLPNGTNSLPLELLPFFDRFKQIYLWLDADEPGRAATKKIAKVSKLFRVNNANCKFDRNSALASALSLTRVWLQTMDQKMQMRRSNETLR